MDGVTGLTINPNQCCGINEGVWLAQGLGYLGNVETVKGSPNPDQTHRLGPSVEM
jgi:hypothetical protein